jgi:hypothetical protein
MLYDTICELWPQYRVQYRMAVERRFIAQYPVTMPNYRVLLSVPRGGPDPLRLFEEKVQ